MKISQKKYLENISLFLKRYPKYAFFFSSIEEEFLLENENARHIQTKELLYNFPLEKFSKWQNTLNLKDKDVLCVYGLGLGHSYKFLKKWLHKKRERDLIFVEDLSFLLAFLKTANAREILLDPKVHLYFKLKDEKVADFTDGIAIDFPFQKMAIVQSLEKKEAPFLEFKQKFLRANVYFSALQIEKIYSCMQWKNFISNLLKLSSSFSLSALKGKFKNIPALICGAGPSLYSEKEIIKKMYDKAFIIAGGSAITALSSFGVQAHMGVVIDPNEEEFLRLQKSTLMEMPIIYTPRVNRKVFDTFNGPLGYLRSSSVGEHYDFAEKSLGIDSKALGSHSREAFSVTTENIALAHFLGFSPIILCGVDLAYSENARYCPGVSDKNEVVYGSDLGNTIIEKEDRLGNKVLTCLRWVMESDYITSYAKTFNANIINSSSLGIGFKEIAYRPLAEIEKSLKPLDLKGYFHNLSFQNFLDISPLKIKKLIEEMKTSLLFCKKCSRTILKELKFLKGKKRFKLQTPQMIVALYDLEKEMAFQYILKNSKKALEKQIAKYYRPGGRTFTKKDHLEMSLDIWKNFTSIINEHIKAF